MSLPRPATTRTHFLTAPLQGQDTVIVVVMEFCDLGSLQRAVNKKAFKPHGKWTYHTTYVRLPILSHRVKRNAQAARAVHTKD